MAVDVIAARYHPGLIYWLEQPKDPLHDKWTYHVIDDAADGGADGVHGLLLGDVDRDGSLDLVGSSGQPKGPMKDALVWYSVPKGAKANDRWPRFALANGDAPGLSHYVALGDVNGDGRPDVASAAKDSPGGNWFAWWEQGKDPRQPWTKHPIADNQVGATNIQIARPVRAAEETAQGNGPISCWVCRVIGGYHQSITHTHLNRAVPTRLWSCYWFTRAIQSISIFRPLRSTAWTVVRAG